MSIATTGQDLAEETRAFNERLARTLAPVPKVYQVEPAYQDALNHTSC